MRHFALVISVLFAAPLCQAGYSEYQLLSQGYCEAFSITTDAAAPDPADPDTSLDYKAYVAKTKRSPVNFWALYGNTGSSTRWADCNWSANEIACTVIGEFRLQSFTCKLGQSYEWSRACSIAGGKVGDLKIYSVDTSEYETGGEPVSNRYLQADLAKFEARCKKPSPRK